MRNVKKILLIIPIFIVQSFYVSASSCVLGICPQIDILNNAILNLDGNIALLDSAPKLDSVYVAPDYFDEQLMFVSSGSGTFINRGLSAGFSLLENLPKSLTKFSFEGDYRNSGRILALESGDVYLSIDKGTTWRRVNINTENQIKFIDFGPYYGMTPRYYFITSDGLFRMNLIDGSINLVLSSDGLGEVMDFKYLRAQTVDNKFWVVKGRKLYKTEDAGKNWFIKEFNSKIIDLQVIPYGPYGASYMLLTEDNKLYFSTDEINFTELTFPKEVSSVKAFSFAENAGYFVYLAVTDKGVYKTEAIESTWQKINYAMTDYSGIGTFKIVKSGVENRLFVVNNNRLYVDYQTEGTLTSFDTGLYSDFVYVKSGYAISKNLLDLHTEKFAEEYKVGSATLEADGDLNGGTMNFYMTADGENWEAVELGVKHVFARPGRDLRWKVEMSTSDTSKTPVLRDVSVNFGMESGCAGFEDVAVDDPYCPAIEYVRAQGIFSGYPDGTFGADLEINRAETVKVITEGFDYEILADDGSNLGFSDVEVGSWYMGYLNTAKTAGIIEGYPDGTFKPGKTVNYVEMMKIFLETAEAELVEPATGEWYQKYVNYATANGLTVYEDLDAGMKRADVAQLFYDWSKL